MRRILTTLLLCLPFVLSAQTFYTWNGSTSTDWHTATNWTPNGIPTTADSVRINILANISLSQNTTVDYFFFFTNNSTVDLGTNTLTVNSYLRLQNDITISNGTLVGTALTDAWIIDGCTIDATLDITTSDWRNVRSSNFNQPASFTHVGSANDTWTGGNTYAADVTFTHSGAGGSWNIGGSQPEDFNANVTVNSNNSGSIRLAHANPGHFIGGTLTVNNSANGEVRISNAANSDVTLNGDVFLNNTSTRDIFICQSASSSATINGNVEITNNTAGGDVRFGNTGGATTLNTGAQISIGAGGFTQGQLLLRNVNQIGTTPQNWILGGTDALLFIRDSEFNGALTAEAPRVQMRENIFNGSVDFTFTGAANYSSLGGNIFNAIATLQNTGAGNWNLSTNLAFSDEYNDDVFFVNSGSGTIRPANQGTTFYRGDIYIDSPTEIIFANGANGIVELDATADQTLFDAGAGSARPRMDRLILSKAGSDFILNLPLRVEEELSFSDGDIVNDDVNVLRLDNGILLTGVSDNAHATGRVEKLGNIAFDFPVGDGTNYRPIGISAPSATGHAFEAQFYAGDPTADGYDITTQDGSFIDVSDCDYWILNRTNGASDVNVTINWENCTTPITLGGVEVARWDGTQWTSEGQTAVSGTITDGSVTSDLVTSFSPFTIGNSINLLPVELTHFDASVSGSNVELEWQTASEENNSHFEIQRSIDGFTFEEVGQVQGVGTSDQVNNYSFVDTDLAAGLYFYRLKQVDFDGAFVHTDIITAQIASENTVDVLYDRFSNTMNIASQDEKITQVVVYNAIGQVSSMNDETGKNIQVPFNGASGVYFVHMRTQSGKSFVEKVVVR